jgi:tRNA(fMet)-specific endonuclease VapC
MNGTLVDTSAYAAFMRGQAEAKLALQRAEDICLSPIVLGELRAGFLRGKHRRKNETELQVFLSSPRVRVVDVDSETADRYAAILHALRVAGTPIPMNDVWIAASAMQYGLRILTTDRHYQKVSQVLIEYIEAE